MRNLQNSATIKVCAWKPNFYMGIRSPLSKKRAQFSPRFLKNYKIKKGAQFFPFSLEKHQYKIKKNQFNMLESDLILLR